MVRTKNVINILHNYHIIDSKLYKIYFSFEKIPTL